MFENEFMTCFRPCSKRSVACNVDWPGARRASTLLYSGGPNLIFVRVLPEWLQAANEVSGVGVGPTWPSGAGDESEKESECTCACVGDVTKRSSDASCKCFSRPRYLRDHAMHSKAERSAMQFHEPWWQRMDQPETRVFLALLFTKKAWCHVTLLFE